MAHVALGEAISGQQIGGSILVLAGVLAISVKQGGSTKK
jgi:drug/metabolite transporter (DMT)-like permease